MTKLKRIGLLSLTCISTLFIACNNLLEQDFPEDNIQSWETENIEIENSDDFRYTIQEALEENGPDHENDNDYIWLNSDVIEINLNGNSISGGTGTIVSGTTVTITRAGTYSISGNLDDGQVIVDTEDEDIVQLILNGMQITNSSGSPLYIKSTGKTVIILADGTENIINDGIDYIFDEPEEDEPNATVFSKDNLSISGNGILEVYANYNDGIASKDGLIIKSGNISIHAVDDGIRGKDYLIVHDGDITIDAGGDGLKSDNDEDATLGYIYLEKGAYSIASGGDAIQAKTDILIVNGDFDLISGGGSVDYYNENTSLKGLKAGVNLIIDQGNYSISSADDAIHSNGNLVINEGMFDIATGDDGMHADGMITINNGNIDISKSYEGIESTVININDGEIQIISSDDGLNVAGGNDGSGMNRPGTGDFSSANKYYIFINGGYTVIHATGDGIDSNGSVSMSDGTVIIHGPTSNFNGALDYQGYFKITGGILIGAGSAGMAEAPDETSTQFSILLNFGVTIQSETLFHIQTSDGSDILTFKPEKKYQSIVFSSPELENGIGLDVYSGGSSSGSVKDGLFEGGTYSPGTKLGNVSLSSIVTWISSR